MSEFHSTHILKCMHCVCMATAIEQHMPTDMFNTLKMLNNLYPGPNRCCIMNRSIIDVTCVSVPTNCYSWECSHTVCTPYVFSQMTEEQ